MIDEADGEICLKVNVWANKDAAQLHEMLCTWWMRGKKTITKRKKS